MLKSKKLIFSLLDSHANYTQTSLKIVNCFMKFSSFKFSIFQVSIHLNQGNDCMWFQKICLKFIHKNATRKVVQFRANRGSSNFMEYFLPKLKLVFYEHFSKHLFVLPTKLSVTLKGL